MLYVGLFRVAKRDGASYALWNLKFDLALPFDANSKLDKKKIEAGLSRYYDNTEYCNLHKSKGKTSRRGKINNRII